MMFYLFPNMINCVLLHVLTAQLILQSNVYDINGFI